MKARRLSNGRIVPTLKQQSFIEHYIATKNGSKAVKLAGYDAKRPEIQAHDNLSKPYIREEIVNLLNEKGLEMGNVVNVHKRNLNQSENYGASQSAVRDYYEIVGLKGQDDKGKASVNVAFILNDGSTKPKDAQ